MDINSQDASTARDEVPNSEDGADDNAFIGSHNSQDRPTRNGEGGSGDGYLTHSQQEEVARQRETDDQICGTFVIMFIYRSIISLQGIIRCIGMAGGELDDTERHAVGDRVITSTRALRGYIRGGLVRPVGDNEVWEREVGGGDLIRHLMAAARV